MLTLTLDIILIGYSITKDVRMAKTETNRVVARHPQVTVKLLFTLDQKTGSEVLNKDFCKTATGETYQLSVKTYIHIMLHSNLRERHQIFQQAPCPKYMVDIGMPRLWN